MAIYTSFKLKRSEEFQSAVNTPAEQPARFSEQYAQEKGFQNQADMRGEDW